MKTEGRRRKIIGRRWRKYEKEMQERGTEEEEEVEGEEAG
jgi:hypothetical protein